MFKKKPKGGKKCIAIFAMLLILAFAVSSVYAESLSRFSNNQNCKMYSIVNTGATALSTGISTSTITVLNHRILGFTIAEADPSAASERIVALYDSATGGETVAKLIDECETSDNVSATRFYPYPKSIETQLTVRQGANTIVTVYYEDKREI